MPRTSCLEMRKERLRRLLDVHYNLIIYQCVSGAIHCLIPEDDSDSDSDSERPVEFGLPNNMVICIVQKLQRLDNIRYLAPQTRHIIKSIEWSGISVMLVEDLKKTWFRKSVFFF